MAGPSNTPDPPENEESLESVRLRAQSEVIQEELDALEDQMKALDQIAHDGAEPEPILLKAVEADEEKRELSKAPFGEAERCCEQRSTELSAELYGTATLGAR